jgi:signal transduction histidine kinase
LVSIESAVTEQRATVMIGDLPTVSGRPAQLELLLQNLVENAVKYRGSRPPKVRIDSRRDGAGWKISCRDNGCGMPSDVQEKVFEPFVRAGDGSLPGSGLGLATCRRIVEGHGGRIWVESSGAGGTTVSFTLPAAGDSEELVVPLVTDPVLAAARRTLGHRGRRTPGRGAQSALRGAVRRHGEPTPSGKTSVG